MGRRLAILAIDLDHFTRVNETLGHGMGDAVLGAVGKRLLNSVRDQDAVARIGGDKFAVAVSRNRRRSSPPRRTGSSGL